jgi:chromosome segregation ATPase
VLADLQTGVVNARNALENTKAQLRLSQRSVAQLTRQTEDLKEGRERLRLENEGLNNVVARKERLLQEVLERARKAEAEANTLKGQLKTETTTSKKALREMEGALAESTALSSKSEREYITLRDSIKTMTESWKADNASLRTEMTKREEKLRRESDEIGKKYNKLIADLKERQELETTIKKLREEDSKKDEELEAFWTKELETLKAELEENDKKGDEAAATALCVITVLFADDYI